MTRRHEDYPLTRHMVRLFEGEFDRLSELYGGRIASAKVLRNLVHSWIKSMDEKAAQKVGVADKIEIDLGEVMGE